MKQSNARYRVGQIIHHRLFQYRGIILDVDATFKQVEDWLPQTEKLQMNKLQPWYHILVDNTDYVTYVAEKNLEKHEDGQPVHHPELKKYFSRSKDGKYRLKKRSFN